MLRLTHNNRQYVLARVWNNDTVELVDLETCQATRLKLDPQTTNDLVSRAVANEPRLDTRYPEFSKRSPDFLHELQAKRLQWLKDSIAGKTRQRKVEKSPRVKSVRKNSQADIVAQLAALALSQPKP